MSNELAVLDPKIIESLVLQGNISKLTPPQKVEYVSKLCERIGVDPLTQPFKILVLQGRETLYADKGCAQQLCKVYDISTGIIKQERIDDVFVVTVRASMPAGRYTDEIGAVTIAKIQGDPLCNALMKATTKAKRRAVLALCGLGMLTEDELETIPGAKSMEIVPEAPRMPLPPTASQSVPTQEMKPVKADSEPKEGVTEAIARFDGEELQPISVEEGRELLKVAKKSGYTKDEVFEYIKGIGYDNPKELNELDYKDVMKHFKEARK